MSTVCFSIQSEYASVDGVDPYTPTLSYHYDDSIVSSRSITGDYSVSEHTAKTIKKPKEDIIITGYIRREYNHEIPKSIINMIRAFETYFQVLRLSQSEHDDLCKWIDGDQAEHFQSRKFKISGVKGHDVYLTIYFEPGDLSMSRIYTDQDKWIKVNFYICGAGISYISGRFGIHPGIITDTMEVKYMRECDLNNDDNRRGFGQIIGKTTYRYVPDNKQRYEWTFYHDVFGIKITDPNQIICNDLMKSIHERSKFCFIWKPSNVVLAEFVDWNHTGYHQSSGSSFQTRSFTIYTPSGWQIILNKRIGRHNTLCFDIIFVEFISPFILEGRNYKSQILTRSNGRWNASKVRSCEWGEHGFWAPLVLEKDDQTFAVQFILYWDRSPETSQMLDRNFFTSRIKGNIIRNSKVH